jgi:predicted Fe-S protein YdhL (DUF1289 family)
MTTRPSYMTCTYYSTCSRYSPMDKICSGEIESYVERANCRKMHQEEKKQLLRRIKNTRGLLSKIFGIK